MENDLRVAWREPRRGSEGAVRRHVAGKILGTRRLHEVARDVKWAERMLRRHRPHYLFSDGLDYALCQTFFIVAKKHGVRTGVTPHGIFIHDFPIDVLGCDPRVGAVVDDFFAWGWANDRWLDSISAKVEKVRAGNLVARRLARRAIPRAPARTRVLVLQYSTTQWDLSWPHSGQFQFFVETLRMLKNVGCGEVRFKLHPGGGSAAYYREIASYFGITCAILKYEPYLDLLAWADIVIGPLGSGAMPEALAAGKPYYAMLLRPNSVNPKCIEGLPVYSSVAELRSALAGGTAPDFDRLLEAFAAAREIPDPAGHTWRMIAERTWHGHVPAAETEGPLVPGRSAAP